MTNLTALKGVNTTKAIVISEQFQHALSFTCCRGVAMTELVEHAKKPKPEQTMVGRWSRGQAHRLRQLGSKAPALFSLAPVSYINSVYSAVLKRRSAV